MKLLIPCWWPILSVVVLSLLAFHIQAFAGPYLSVEPLPPNIVDMHCHVAGIGAGNSGCFVSPALRNSWRFNIYLRAYGVSKSELEERGDDLVAERISQLLSQSKYVNKTLLLALDGVINTDGMLDINRTEVYVPNELGVAGDVHKFISLDKFQLPGEGRFIVADNKNL